MNQVINSIIKELKEEFKISSSDIERIIDSEFKTLQLAIENKDLRTVNLIYLGKFKPSNWLISNHELIKERKRYHKGLEERLNS